MGSGQSNPHLLSSKFLLKVQHRINAKKHNQSNSIQQIDQFSRDDQEEQEDSEKRAIEESRLRRKDNPMNLMSEQSSETKFFLFPNIWPRSFVISITLD